MSQFDLDPFLNGRMIKAGRSSVNPSTFSPRQGRGANIPAYDPTRFNPFDQVTSGEPLARPGYDDQDRRVRTSGNLPAFLLQEEHSILVRHPEYKSVTYPDGSVAHFQTRGEIICTCRRSHGKYEDIYGEPDPDPRDIIDWPADMIQQGDGITDDSTSAPLMDDNSEWKW